jgi:hypothetical protein
MSIKFQTVSIKSRKMIPILKKFGPVNNITLPKTEVDKLIIQNFEVVILKTILKDGTIHHHSDTDKVIPADSSTLVNEDQQSDNVSEGNTSDTDDQSSENTIEETTNEAKNEQSDNASEKNESSEVILDLDYLLSTIELNGESIDINPLTVEEYSSYSVSDLRKFVKKYLELVSPDDADSTLKTLKTHAKLISYITENILSLSA